MMEKIKKFFSNKRNLWLTVGGAVVVAAAILLVIFLPGNSGDTNTPVADLTGCTVKIQSEGGKVMANVGVYVYKNADKADMVDFVRTDDKGVAVITKPVPAGGVVVLDGVPAGYVTEETYPITQAETKISLKTKLLAEMTQVGLGDVMFDFAVTAVDGTEYTLSKLLSEKKAVVLNFWYAQCQPCKEEFPFLQEAYDASSDVALLAMNCYGDSKENIEAFISENGLTMPVAAVDKNWANALNITLYPTTIIIDRFGTVALSYAGGIEKTKVFTDAFAYFTAEDYTQSVVTDINTLVKEEAGPEEGSAEKPAEFGGVTEFEITVEPGATYYCNVYRVSGMELKVESENLKVTCGDAVYESVDGILAFQLAPSMDVTVPVKLGFTNTAAEAQTYKVTFVHPEGSMENPRVMESSEATITVPEDSSQGFYLLYTAKTGGNLTLKGLEKNAGYNVVLSNKDIQKTLEEDAADENGKPVLVISVAEGDQVKIQVVAVPDTEGNYPAVTASFSADILQEKEEESSGNQGGATGGNQGGAITPTEPAELNTKGELVNTEEILKSMETFETESIGGGKMVLYAINGIGTATIQIADDSAYIIYNDKTYIPQNGVVSVTITREDVNTPTLLKIGNGRSTAKTYKVNFYYPAGSQGNPIQYELSKTVTTNVKRGDDQGVYYTYTAAKAGTFTIKIESCSAATGCGIAVTTKTGVTIQETVISTEGDSVSIKLDANQRIEIIIAALPDQRNNYPKATIETSAALV